MHSVILQYCHDQRKIKCLSITVMYCDTHMYVYTSLQSHLYIHIHLCQTSCVYVRMKAALSLIYAVLISTIPVSLVESVHIQLQDCPSLVEPNGSGIESSPANISDDNYCIVDHCNIRLLTTGELLEVTTLSDDHLLATNMSTQESVAISRATTETPCLLNYLYYGSHLVISILAFLFRFLLVLLIAVASGYVLGIHIMFKVLCKLLGKLLMVYNTAVLVALFASLLLIMSNLLFAPGSQAVCQVLVHGYSLTFMLYESIGTVVTAQVYYMMYRDYKNMPDISPNWSGQLFEHYMMFAFAPMLPMAILTIGFDFTARVGNETILPSGHCILPPANLYESLFLAYMYIALHKICQLLVFIYTLHYFHKLYVSFGKKQQSTAVGKSNCQSVNQIEVQPIDRPVSSSSSESTSNSSVEDDGSILESNPAPANDTHDHNEYRRFREQMTGDEIRNEKRKYLRRLIISASFPGATLLSIIFWFLCIGVGPLLRPFSAGGGDIALFAQQATIAAVFLSSKTVYRLCKERLEAFTNK